MILKNLVRASLILAIFVVVLGTWTRLNDAGLSCPDWPTCYGTLLVPTEEVVSYDRKLEPHKVWLEMLHRYAATILGIISIAIFFVSIRARYNKKVKILSFILLTMIVAQGLLGALTVTELVHPLIVTLHLLGGFIITTIIFLLLKNLRNNFENRKVTISKNHKTFISIIIIMVFIQIFLGGWTSTNYAALACGDFFPSCLGKYIHPINFSNIFFIGELGVDYEYGILSNEDRIGIQMLHRIGALVLTIAMIIFFVVLKRYHAIQSMLLLTGFIFATQIILGLLNIYLSLPIIIATLHNITALLLLISCVNIRSRVK